MERTNTIAGSLQVVERSGPDVYKKVRFFTHISEGACIFQISTNSGSRSVTELAEEEI
jgi:hypothetical protein